MEASCHPTITPDEWHVNLFGHDTVGTYGPDHGRRHGVIESMLLWRVAARALSLGINVILDFGFWAKEERDDYRSRARELGAVSEVIYTDVDDEE